VTLSRFLHLTPTLTILIGAFVSITAGLVLAVQVVTSERVVKELGAELVVASVNALQREFQNQLTAVEEQASFIARALDTGTILIDEGESLDTFTYGTLAGTPESSAIAIIPEQGPAVLIERGPNDGVLVSSRIPRTTLPDELDLETIADAERTGTWTPVRYVPESGHSYVSFALPVWEGTQRVATVAIGITLDELSALTQKVSSQSLRVFLIYNDGFLLAHPDLRENSPILSPDRPILPLEEAPDRFLAGFSAMQVLEESKNLPGDMTLREGWTEAGDRRFVVTDLVQPGFGGIPVTIGADFPATLLDQPIQQLSRALLIGLLLLGGSVIGAAFLARSISLPVRRAAISATRVARLDLDDVQPLPKSPIKELNDLSTGFNSMVSGLKAFNRYVPRALVNTLLQEGRAGAPPEERELAVLFTDIAGYTSISEGLSAGETAAFINEHLALVGGQIRAHGGTIDKYIGDAVMAFWGAPDALDNPARDAAAAALAIAHALRDDNQERARRGLPPVRLRIGLHVGPLVVGDIGAPERVNYTVIGDTVNIAARLESLGKEIDPGADIIITTSREVADQLDDGVQIETIGLQHVKGRDRAIEVVRLVP